MDAPNGARAWLDVVLDDDYEIVFDDVVGGDPLGFPGYVEQLERARAKTGCSESVLVAAGSIDGARIIAISFEFGFLGGSMGVAAGERICRAFELAAREEAPVVALTASGGARMQEGMLALAQMPATLIARRKLAEAHQPFIAYLRNPTTGGVYASFGSSADLLWAEPGATIGFAGPRVAETFTGEPVPEGSHTAEWGESRGTLHEVVPASQLRERLSAIVHLSDARQEAARPPEPIRGDEPPLEVVTGARRPERARASDHIVEIAVSGSASLRAGIAFAGGTHAVVITQMRRPLSARDYRAGRSAIALARRLDLPIVTFIDTPGADPSGPSEADGIAREISLTFEALLSAPVPTISCVTGEGGSGGALAFAACDRLLIQEGAFFSVIAPEGAATILKRADIDAIAAELRLTAHDLRAFGLADAVVPDDGRYALGGIAWALSDIRKDGGAPTKRRYDRWRVWQP